MNQNVSVNRKNYGGQVSKTYGKHNLYLGIFSVEKYP